MLDYFYIKYIDTYCKDGVIGKCPVSVIKPRDIWTNHSKEVKERFESNLIKLSKMMTTLSVEYDEMHCDFLEKILRQPLYAAIDMLRIKFGNYPSENGRPLSKAECCDLYKEEFPKIDTSDLFIVLNMRKMYRNFLKERKGTTSEYVRLLEEIDNIYPNARNVIEKNLELVAK